MFSTMMKAPILALCLMGNSYADVVDFEEIGGISGDESTATAWKNGGLLNDTLASLKPFDTLIFPADKSFHFMGGIMADGLDSVTIQIDGAISFSDNIDEWPRDADGHVYQCLHFDNSNNVTFTSTSAEKGLIDGRGKKWWGIPGIGYLHYGENRPKLFEVDHSTNILVENIYYKDSPYWTFWVHNVDGLEVRNCEITANRTDKEMHDIIDMTAFNTDGFDVTGKNVWIHDCSIWNQDDTIAVKDGSENMLFERINASGVGLTIGSIGDSTVRNITFRDCYMPNTYKVGKCA
jgi:polygalacturonase